MRIVSAGHAFYAAILITLGLQGLATGDFTSLWQPVPNGIPAREALAYICAVVSLACGIGLFWRRTAGIASGVILGSLVLWFLAWRVRGLFVLPLIEGTWSCGAALAMIASALALFASFISDELQTRRGVPHDRATLRTARIMYGVALLPFGYAHFANPGGTAALVPGWLPGHMAWAYVTGATFIAASVAVLMGIHARPATALSAVQLGLFGLLVWVPIVAGGSASVFQWTEFMTTLMLTAAAWVVADSWALSQERILQVDASW